MVFKNGPMLLTVPCEYEEFHHTHLYFKAIGEYLYRGWSLDPNWNITAALASLDMPAGTTVTFVDE